MSRDDSHRGPEQPRSEPEIIPPGRDQRGPRGGGSFDSAWLGIDERDGVRRVYLKRPSIWAIVLALLVVGVVAGLVLLVLAGLVLFWVPVVAVVILLTIVSAAMRSRWHQLRLWWANRSR